MAVIDGVTTMKMMSRTSITSIIGVTLISAFTSLLSIPAIFVSCSLGTANQIRSSLTSARSGQDRSATMTRCRLT